MASPTIHASPRILAVDWRSRVRSAPLAALLAAVGLLILGASRDPTLAGWLIAAAAVMVVIAVPNALARLTERVRITSESVEYRGLLGVTRRCARTEVSRLIRLRVAVLGPRFVFTRLILVDSSDRARISLQTEWFSLADLEELQHQLDVPWSDANDPLTPRAANRLYPGAASFAVTHRFEMTALGIVLALLVIGLPSPVAHG